MDGEMVFGEPFILLENMDFGALVSMMDGWMDLLLSIDNSFHFNTHKIGGSSSIRSSMIFIFFWLPWMEIFIL